MPKKAYAYVWWDDETDEDDPHWITSKCLYDFENAVPLKSNYMEDAHIEAQIYWDCPASLVEFIL